MKFISYTKYKTYLESNGYVLEKGINIYVDLRFFTYFFSKPGKEDKYAINVFMSKDGTSSDNIMSINKGHGSPFLGWRSVKVDMRRKFWKDLV